MVALRVCQSEEPLFQDRVIPIPQRQRETKHLLVIRDAGQAIFSPAVRARTCLVMAEVLPCIPILTVILTNGPPLAFAEIRPPLEPFTIFNLRLFQANLFSSHTIALPRTLCAVVERISHRVPHHTPNAPLRFTVPKHTRRLEICIQDCGRSFVQQRMAIVNRALRKRPLNPAKQRSGRHLPLRFRYRGGALVQIKSLGAQVLIRLLASLARFRLAFVFPQS